MLRSELLNVIGGRVATISPGRRARVGIDGPDAAGKTTLADELRGVVAASGRPVIRASVDGFHNPASVRYRRGRDSAEGYYDDAFDYATLVTSLLEPLGPGGSGQYRRAAFDLESDRAIDSPLEVAPEDAILLFDGVFLHRPELVGYWDFSIFLEVGFDVVLRRAEVRDVALRGSPPAVRERYQRRYLPAQRSYFAACSPHRRASVVIRNADPANPCLAGSGEAVGPGG